MEKFGRMKVRMNMRKEWRLMFVAEDACAGEYLGSKGGETGSGVARTAPGVGSPEGPSQRTN